MVAIADSPTFLVLFIALAAAAIIGAWTVGLLPDYGMPLRLAIGISPAAALILAAESLIWRLTDRLK